MGYGLPFGIGFALAKKLKGEDGTIYVLMSDGEMQIGTIWEAALIAAHHKLDNLVVIVDYNEFQAMGKTNEVLNIEPLRLKWSAFNWNVVEIDGHDYEQIEEQGLNFHEWQYKPNLTPRNAWPASKDRSETRNHPTCVIAHTIKGKGISFMEGNNLFHYKNLSEIEYWRSIAEINGTPLDDAAPVKIT